MEFLRFLEGLRTPLLDTIFSIITLLGEETLLILVGIIFFWCINKHEGYYILSVGFVGTLVNQFLKLLCRIPRPWVRDPSFTVVESAVEGATGYSFPSGHTQAAGGVFGGVARILKRRAVTILCIVLFVLVAFSRMYLGVHTPLDVLVSTGVALLLVLGAYPLVHRAMKTHKGTLVFFAVMLGISLAYLLFVLLFPFPADIDVGNYESGLKNAYKILGCTLGLLIAYLVDWKYIRFETKAAPAVQVLKVVLGLIPVLVVKELLRKPIELVCGEMIGSGVRYLLLAVVAGAVWPMAFPYLSRIVEHLKAKREAKRAGKS